MTQLVGLVQSALLLGHVARTLGLDNRRLVALFPSDGLLFTLSYSVNRADFDLGVARAILASLHLPT